MHLLFCAGTAWKQVVGATPIVSICIELWMTQREPLQQEKEPWYECLDGWA
jgi:hypothetical protein